MTQLKLFLFGAKEIRLNDVPVHIARRKALAMLIYLVVTEKPHERETLGAMFWPESADSRNQVRVALSSLRADLGVEWFSEHTDVLHISNAQHVWVDVLAFKTLNTLSIKEPERCIDYLEQAIELSRGGFLAGFTLRDCPEFNSWVQSEEFYLERETNKTLQRVIECHRQAGNFERAVDYAEQYVSRDSLNEDSYRILMELYLKNNCIHDVIRIFELCAETLQNELGIAPSSELQVLLQQALARHQNKKPEEPKPSNDLIPYAHHAFFGRETELNTVLDLLADNTCRMVSLVGIGGIGKTHLATRVSELVPTRANLEACFVSLEGIQNQEQAALVLANRLQLRLLSNSSVIDQIVSYLKPKRLLVILDNVEQIALALSPMLSQIIQHTSGIKLLITSRIMLQMHEEYVIRLGGLTYPNRYEEYRVREIQEYDSVRVFMHWVKKRNTSFQLTETNAHAVAELCHLLEGIPLAIRLAAVWCELLSVEDLLNEIHQNVNMLHSQLVDIPEKHRSMRALFDSIWTQLSVNEQQAFTKLAMFRGGFTRQAAEQVAEVTPILLKSLLDKSLLVVDSDLGRRYRIHEILRMFATENELLENEKQALVSRYVDYYARYVNIRELDLRGNNQLRAMREIDNEFANIQTAWSLAVEDHKVDILCTMLEGLNLYLRFRGYWDEGHMLFKRAQIHLAQLSDHKSQHLINKLSARYYDFADDTFPTLLKLKSAAETFGDTKEAAYLTAEIAWQAHFLGRDRLSLRYFHMAFKQYQAIDDKFQTASVLRGIALCETALGNFKNASRYNQESMSIQQHVGDPFGLSLNYVLQGEIHLLKAEIHPALDNLLAAYDYHESNVGESLALRQTRLLPWCYVFVGEVTQGAELAKRLADATATLGVYGEHLLGLLVLALVAAISGNTYESGILLQHSQEILADPDLQTGQGKFELNLRLLCKSMLALIYCLNGRLDEGHILIEELKGFKTSFRLPIIMRLMFTAEVIGLYLKSRGYLHDELIRWLSDQPWLTEYLEQHRFFQP